MEKFPKNIRNRDLIIRKQSAEKTGENTPSGMGEAKEGRNLWIICKTGETALWNMTKKWTNCKQIKKVKLLNNTTKRRKILCITGEYDQ